MKVIASAPGKLFLLGEYAVLEGSPAIIAAVSARARVTISPRSDRHWSVVSIQDGRSDRDFTPGQLSGVALLDAVLGARAADTARCPPCEIQLDTASFFGRRHGQKMGLGSSAALLVALDAALGRWQQQPAVKGQRLQRLRGIHDGFQGSPGSGGDLAASLHGGLISYQIPAPGGAEIGSVRLPDSVGFASICTGQAASTSEFLKHFRTWQSQQPDLAANRLGGLDQVARAGRASLEAGDGEAFLAAVAAYGDLLAELGQLLGVPISTPEHEQLKQLAEQNGVIYKSSGAGGGDMGVAFATDPQRLAAFLAAGDALGYERPGLAIDPAGLTLETSPDD